MQSVKTVLIKLLISIAGLAVMFFTWYYREDLGDLPAKFCTLLGCMLFGGGIAAVFVNKYVSGRDYNADPDDEEDEKNEEAN